MDMTHLQDILHADALPDADFPMAMGAGAVDPELIEPIGIEIDIEELIVFGGVV